MTALKPIKYKLEDGSSVFVAVDLSCEPETPTGGEGHERKLKDALATAWKIMPDIAASLESLKNEISANEIGVEFGVALTSNGSIIIASTGMQASFKITAKWANRDGRD